MSGEGIRRELSHRVRAASGSADARLALLLRAGELESALEDLEHPAALRARKLTDDAASACRTGSAAPLAGWSCGRTFEAELPPQLRLRRPEGYAYYALHPAAYAGLLQPRHQQAGGVAIVGARSIGTSLSAVLLAELRARQVPAERITVRPTGHPWSRELVPSAAFGAFVRRWPAACFWVVDEGPGLSGSTFLSIAEALERYGVPCERIELMASHHPDPARLVARDGAARWSRYRANAVAPALLPAGARDLNAGSWRAELYPSEREWPACDVMLERHKYREGGALLKFVGLPPYGEAPLARGQLLARAGFCPEVEARSPGYVAQRWLEGRPLRAPVRGRARLRRLLDYLVFRSRECRSEAAPVGALQEMLQVNWAEAIGRELPSGLQLRVECPVYADARLAPHEWIESPAGELYKVDASDHADDHSFPGPCDSAWDVAGAILEWRLTPALASELCAEYHRRTRDDVSSRLTPYLVAYSCLKVARGQCAALSAPPAEQARLARELDVQLRTLRRLAASAGNPEGPCVCSSSC